MNKGQQNEGRNMLYTCLTFTHMSLVNYKKECLPNVGWYLPVAIIDG